MQQFNKKAPTEAEAFSLRFVPLASCPAVFRPISLFTVLQGFEQMVIRAGLKFLHLVINPVHGARSKMPTFSSSNRLRVVRAKDAFRRPSRSYVWGFWAGLKIVHSHCISSCGALVRGGSALTR